MAGIAGPALFLVILAAAGSVRWPDYHPLRQYVSELGTGPYQHIQNLNFVAFGVLMVVFALGLRQGSIEEGAYKTGPVLVGVFGLGMCLMGIFHLDPPTSYEPERATWEGILHLVAFVVAFGSVVPACFIFADRFRRNSRWQSYSAYSLLTGVTATFCFLMLFAAWPMYAWKGLWQVLLIAVILAWIEAVAIRLFRLALG